MKMSQEAFEAHQRRHGFAPEPVKASPIAPEVMDAAEAKAEMEIQGEIANVWSQLESFANGVSDNRIAASLNRSVSALV